MIYEHVKVDELRSSDLTASGNVNGRQVAMLKLAKLNGNLH